MAVQAGGSSRPAAQRLIHSRPLLIVSQPRLVVRKKDLGNKITAAAYTGLREDVPQVSLHGVHRDHQTVSDVDGREALQDESGQLLLTLSQAVGRHQKRGDSAWVRGFDDDGNPLAVDSSERYAVQDHPAARAGQHPSHRDFGRVAGARSRTRCAPRHGKHSGRQPRGRSVSVRQVAKPLLDTW